MIYVLLLLGIPTVTAEQRAKYEAICLREVAGTSCPLAAKFHKWRVNACIVELATTTTMQ